MREAVARAEPGKREAMKVAIMQPYFLPYMGYFQLMAAVDRFILLDDANYINGGWVNRNRIPSRNGPRWLTLPLAKASQNRRIRDIEILPDNGWKRKMERTVASTYAHAPGRAEVFPLFIDWLAGASGNLSDFLCRSLRDAACFMGLSPDLVPASSVYPRNGLMGADRILDICLREGATTYVNPPGGRELYDEAVFSKAGIELKFLQFEPESLHLRYSGSEGAVLSILDLMMLNSADALKHAAAAYRLVPAGGRSA